MKQAQRTSPGVEANLALEIGVLAAMALPRTRLRNLSRDRSVNSLRLVCSPNATSYMLKVAGGRGSDLGMKSQ